MVKEIKAIIFEMNDVLIDAREWLYAALNLALAAYGVTITPEEHHDHYDGPDQSEAENAHAREGA